MPTSSAMRASRRLSGQVPDQRSGTRVTARPEEQLAPNRPILSAWALYMLMRSRIEIWGASTFSPLGRGAGGRGTILHPARAAVNGRQRRHSRPREPASAEMRGGLGAAHEQLGLVGIPAADDRAGPVGMHEARDVARRIPGA